MMEKQTDAIDKLEAENCKLHGLLENKNFCIKVMKKIFLLHFIIYLLY